MPHMDFERDIANEIVRYFDGHSIEFDHQRSTDASYLLERYFRARTKMIFSRPRSVHYSTELRAKLGTLERRYRQPLATIEERFKTGGDLTEFLSRLARNVDSIDAMLNDLRIHHLHLGVKRSPNETQVERSDLLLFVWVGVDDAYLIDIRPHPRKRDPNDYGWSHQEYLAIIERNWPDLLDPYELPGVSGDSTSDSGRKELQRKYANVVTRIGGRAIAPPGGGMTASGANLRHVWMAKRQLWLVDQVQTAIDTHWAECRRDLQHAGVHADDDAEFRLIRIEDGDFTPELQSLLRSELGRSGWIVLHVASGKHVDWNFEWE